MYTGDNNNIDASAVFAGGGFVPSQTTQNHDPIPSAFSKSSDVQTLIPLTGLQIAKAFETVDADGKYNVDGAVVRNVKVVGRLLNKVDNFPDISFILDDATCPVNCNRWVDDALDTREMEAISEGMYVRVHGQLRDVRGKKTLVVFGIKPVIDFDEITHHFVECIYVHSYHTKLVKQQASSSNQPHMPSYQTGPSHQLTGQRTGHRIPDGLSEIQKMILEYLHTPTSLSRESGVHQEELASQLGVPLDRLLQELNNLVDEGHIFPTIDDAHYKSTINC